NNNPTGINQYKECPPKGDIHIAEILRDCHRQGWGRTRISDFLEKTHKVKMSPTTVQRRMTALGLFGSSVATARLPDEVKMQLILDQMARDPLSRQGPNSVKEGILFDTGIKLTREYTRNAMHLQDPTGAAACEPTAKKVHKAQLVALGPHHEWSADGHDKLSALGFPIWGIRDKWTGQWLCLRVVPNNRLRDSMAYLYLEVIHELGGMPLQMTTDCGIETTVIYGLASALRDTFSPELPRDELPAHRFLRSIHNITIERGWAQLRIKWVDNMKTFWEGGASLYHPEVVREYNLVMWLWPKLLQQELDYWCSRQNVHKIRFDKEKKLPSGDSPNTFMADYPKYHGEWCLQAVDKETIAKLMDALGGEDLVKFIPDKEFNQAQEIYNGLGAPKLTYDNIWNVYMSMLPFM
ncbi:hypothetical protein BDN71DRAFT_1405132, partial [Pleurotus eryngii]